MSNKKNYFMVLIAGDSLASGIGDFNYHSN